MAGKFAPAARTWELISALQKFIRRGMEEEAGQAFFELAESGYASWALSRMQICAHEDCGLADPAMVSFALRSIDDCKAWVKAKNDAWRLPASNAILALCRCGKSREADHFQAAMRGRNNRKAIDIPDYCYDKHTAKGKAMGRGIDHFLAEAAVIHNGTVDQYADEASEFWRNGGPQQSPEQLAFSE